MSSSGHMIVEDGIVTLIQYCTTSQERGARRTSNIPYGEV